VKVGLLSPITGGLSAYAPGFENAAKLAVADLNARTDTMADWQFELKVYDSKTDPTASSEAMTQAVTDGMAYVVGAAGSSNTLAAAAVAKTNKIPLISYASTSPELTSFEDDGYLWRTPPSDALQGQVIADLAKKNFYSSMVIVTLDNAYGAGLAASIKTNMPPNTVAKTISYAETQTDFSSIVEQMEAEFPDVVVAISYATDGSLLFREMHNQELVVPVIGADGVADVSIFDEATGTQEAMQNYTVTKPSGVASAEKTAFDAAYKAAYPTATGDIYTLEAYDAVMAGALAIFDADSTAGADMIASLATITWNGTSGPMGFDANGDSLAGFYLISEVRADKMTAVATWTAPEGLVITESGWKMLDHTGEATEDDSPFPFYGFIAAIVTIGVVTKRRRRR
ncbi:MAG: ABC transporter substrate-binding protein, partial [Candidatus Kariarchaeaceae archaeon]|jgi:ABC-type branched-subunit amino acid transport system substrate-binding protein